MKDFTFYKAIETSSENFGDGTKVFNMGDIIRVDWNAYDTNTAENLTQKTMSSPFCTTDDMQKVQKISEAEAQELRFNQIRKAL